MNTVVTRRLTIGLLLSLLAGCLQSDAARMEEMRKYAGAGVPDNDDEAEVAAAQTPATNYVPPVRGATAKVAANSPGQAASSSPNSQVKITKDSLPRNSSGSAATIPAGAVSDTMTPPATPLSNVERRKRTLENLEKIAAAMEAFRDTKNGASYPPQFTSDVARQPLLSWRVQLLPFLGYADLYNQFKHNERWDSAHNRELIQLIPAVYQSPERFDVYTNYLVPTGGSAAFDGAQPKPIRRWEDGLENSIILVEADDDQSVIWTQPIDWEFDPREARKGLGNLRKDGFFAVWGGGQLSVVPSRGADVRTAFTVDGGDVTVATLRKPAYAEPGGLASTFRRNTASNATTLNNSPTSSLEGGVDHAVGRTDPHESGRTAGGSTQGLPDAQEAYTEGRESDAIKLFYAEAVLGNVGLFRSYRWVPALSRPAPIVRYGIGIDYSGEGALAARRTAFVALNNDSQPSRSNRVERAYQRLTGEFGKQVLALLQAQPSISPFQVVVPEPTRYVRDDETIAPQASRSPEIISPNVQFLGVESARTLLAAAEKNQVDVLVYYEIKNRGRSRDVRVSLIDVVRKKKLFATSRLNSRDVQVAKADLLEDDPTLEVLVSLRDFLVEKLDTTSFPSGLNETTAARRVSRLSQQASNPLQRLAEIQLYRHLGLLSVKQQSDALADVLDESAALTLIGGSADEKREVLDHLLPEEPIVVKIGS